MQVWRPHYEAKGGVVNESHKKFSTFKVEMPVPYRICAEISKKSNL